MSEALVKVESHEMSMDRPSPRDIIRQATEEANVLAEVINGQKLFAVIQGKKFVKVEGWVTLATLRGCLPREVSVEELPEGRYVATVELVRMNDGAVLSRASAECGGPEDHVWASRQPNARRSMAITRATGKVCRIGFSWVMAMSGFEVTPAEEMDFSGGNQQEASGPNPVAAPKAAPRPQSAPGPVVGAPVWVGKIIKMDPRSGTNATTKKSWTSFTFTGADGQRFITFSESIASGIMKLEGSFVEIVFSDEGKGATPKIEEYRSANESQVPL